jgi:hypothetical protein
MGSDVDISFQKNKKVNAKITWNSYYNIDQIELIFNGNIIENFLINDQQKKGIIDKDIIVPNDGWIAARIKSETRDSFFQPVWAHTSPIYISVGNDKILERVSSANHFIKKIDESLEWIDKKGKFYSNKQRKEILDLHREAKSLYKKLVND